MSAPDAPDRGALRPLPRVGASSARLGMLSVVGLATGLLRESAIAYRFGLSPAYDAFLLASLPFDLFSAIAAIQMAAVQRSLSAREHSVGRGNAYAFWSALTRRLGVSFLALGVACALLGRVVLSLGLKSLGHDQRHEIVTLLVLMIPAPALGAWMALQSAALNAEHRFLALPITGILLNVITATAAVTLGSLLGPRALVLGTVVGLVTGITIQYWLFRRVGFVRERRIETEPGAAGDFFRESRPLIGLAVLGRVYLGVERLLAAGLSAGTVSALAFASRFATIPVAVLSAVGNPLFALLVGHAVRGNLQEFARAGERGMRLTLFVVTPVILFLVLFAEPTVAVLLQRGSFGAADVPLTASAVRAFAWGMFGWVGSDLAARILWARSRYWVTLQLAAAFMLINAVAAVILREVAGGLGLATARSIGFGCYLVLALVMVQRECPDFRAWHVGRALVRQSVVALGCGALLVLLFKRFGVVEAGFAFRLVALPAAGLAMGVLYVAIESLVLRSDEGLWMRRLVRDKLRIVATALGRRSET